MMLSIMTLSMSLYLKFIFHLYFNFWSLKLILVMFLSTVMFISSIVILYSKAYMADDKSIDRFTYIIMLFVFSMMLLIFRCFSRSLVSCSIN